MNLKLLMVLGLLLSGCGGGGDGGGGDSSTTTTSTGGGTTAQSCATDPLLIGEWRHNSVNATLLFKSNCLVYSDYCASTLAITQSTSVLEGYSTTTAVVATTNYATSCLNPGSHTCIYSVYTASGATQLSFNCGLGTSHYTKVN